MTVIFGLITWYMPMQVRAVLLKGYHDSKLNFEVNTLPKSISSSSADQPPEWLGFDSGPKQKPLNFASTIIAQNLPDTIYYFFQKSFLTDANLKFDLKADLWKHKFANKVELLVRPAITMQNSQTTMWQVQGYQLQLIFKLP